MNLFARAPSVPELEDEEEDNFPAELPTTPAKASARALYDRDLHELVGQLLAHAAKSAQKLRAMRVEMRQLRLDVRRLTRKQTLQLGAGVGVYELVQWLIERFGG